MQQMELVTHILIAILSLVCGHLLLRKYKVMVKYAAMMDKFPGPIPHLIFGSTKEYKVPREQMANVFESRFKKYGPVVRIWNLTYIDAEIFISKPEYIEVILSSMQHIKKSTAYNRFTSWLGTGLLTSTGSKWHLHRKLITPTFHFKILEGFFDVFVEKSNVLVANMKNLPTDTVVNLVPLIARCTLDIICETAMGTQLNIQEDKEHDLYVKTVKELSETIVYREFRPWLHPDFIFYKTEVGKQYLQNLHIVHSFTERVIQERKSHRLKIIKQQEQKDLPEGSKKRLALLDLLLDTSEGESALTDLEIREEVDTFMFEGHDTTAMAITWTLYLLGRHPYIQEAVVQELDELVPGSQAPTSEALAEMKYLERVIKEALRLYPSVPFIARRIEQDLPLDEMLTIPAGTNVVVDILHTHRDFRQFPNPDSFDPDNFLPERTQERHPYAYIPFSAGPRNCIGQKFAMLEEKTILSQVLQSFKIESIEENAMILQEMTLKPVNGLCVKLTPRKS